MAITVAQVPTGGVASMAATTIPTTVPGHMTGVLRDVMVRPAPVVGAEALVTGEMVPLLEALLLAPERRFRDVA